MGLFDFLKKKQNCKAEQEPPIPESEKIYYRPDGYYTDYSYPGTHMARKVITFEERKKTSCPSKSGLYVAEILLLEYCSYGIYPHPKNGYPGFWWFEYGIRNVGAKLDSLRERGYIEYCSAAESLHSFTVAQLKELASSQNIHASGKKDAIIEQITSSVSADILDSIVTDKKYKLTPKGEAELQENAYVPYMHKSPDKTTDDTRFVQAFNVWTINKKIGSGDTTHWEEIVSTSKSSVADERVDRAARSSEIVESCEFANPKLLKNTTSKYSSKTSKRKRPTFLFGVILIAVILCIVKSCGTKAPESEYAVVDRFIEKFGVEKITGIVDMDIHGEDYRHEFRLSAFDDAVGKRGTIEGGSIEIVNYGNMGNTQIRVYAHVDTVEQATSLCTSVIRIFDSSISASKISQQYSSLYSYGDARFAITPVDGYIIERSSRGYDVLVDCSKILF